jgi:hypothetical protein
MCAPALDVEVTLYEGHHLQYHSTRSCSPLSASTHKTCLRVKDFMLSTPSLRRWFSYTRLTQTQVALTSGLACQYTIRQLVHERLGTVVS